LKSWFQFHTGELYLLCRKKKRKEKKTLPV